MKSTQRPISFLLSVVLHVIWVLLLPYLPSGRSRDLGGEFPRITVTPIPLEERKVIWYDLRKEKIPEVSPVTPVGKSNVPTGRELSQDTLIALLPKARPGRQVIWQPPPKIEIAQQEIQAPNLVLVQPAAPATPEKKQTPRAFVPPGPTPVRETSPALIEAAPEIAIAERSLDQVKLPVPAGVAGPPKPKPKAFVPPPSRAAGSGQGPGGGNVLGEAPPPEFGAGAAGEVAKVNLAIIGIDPSESMKVGLPAGTRAAQFSKAPVIGEPSTGSVGAESGVRMPGVRVGAGAGAPKVPTVPDPSTRKLVVEMSVPSHALTVAAPLRPSARQVPRIVEERFHRRNVYTLIVPQPKMPVYTGDWVIWFAEMEERPGEAAQMRSPVPLRKHILLGGNGGEAGTPVEGNLRFSAVIQKDGTITGIALAGMDSAGLANAAAKDLSEWEFRAASRNGQAVDVEVMIQIPFRLIRSAGR